MRTAIAIAALILVPLTTTGCDRDSKKGPAQTPAAGGQAVEPVEPAKVAKVDPAAAAAMGGGLPMGTGKAGPIDTNVLPPGHPPIGNTAPPTSAGALPPGHPPTGALPPGHPPTGALPPGHPPTGASNPSLPPGHPPTAGLPKPASTKVPAPPAGREFTVAGHTLQAPKSWDRQTPSSSMRIAQFALPKQGADPRDGVCTVIVAGGDVQANINRWRGQFKENPEAKTDTHTIGEVTATLVRIQGTFMEQARPMAGGPGVARENYVMRAIIAPVGQRTVFIKAWGPAPTMDHYDAEFVAMAKSMTKTP